MRSCLQIPALPEFLLWLPLRMGGYLEVEGNSTLFSPNCFLFMALSIETQDNGPKRVLINMLND